MFFSIIIPLYNRPQEIDELLYTLTKQTYLQFEVLVIEDGSKNDAKAIVNSYADKLDIKYYFKENAGQGFAVILVSKGLREIILSFLIPISSFRLITWRSLKITFTNII